MNKAITLIVLATATAAAGAATVASTEPVKSSLDSKKPLIISKEGGYSCPDGFDLYVRAVKPEVKKGEKEVPGDYESFYFVKSANGQPAVIVSRPSVAEYVPACLAIK